MPEQANDSDGRDDDNIVQRVFDDPNSIKIYANGFFTALSTSDILIILQTGTKLAGTIMMSYNTAKALALELSARIESFEKQTGQEVLTLTQIAERLNKPDATDNS